MHSVYPLNTDYTHQKEQDDLIAEYRSVRQQTIKLCQSLSVEDFSLQAIEETSPPKWHLAHTTWFFETFILKVYKTNYQAFNPYFEYLFNSYYNGIGKQFSRAERGLLSRPSVDEIMDYREYVDTAISECLSCQENDYLAIKQRLVLGMHHEQQHQELLLTDLKYSFSRNPMLPIFSEKPLPNGEEAPLSTLQFSSFNADQIAIGFSGDGFCFDNELPVHTAYINSFAIANRPVSCGEYLLFMQDGGYQKPEYWLAEGWNEIQQQQLTAPLYWQKVDDQWFEFTLHGLRKIDINRPACHISAYEADAYARWAGARLPTEYEWELFAQHKPIQGHFIDSGEYHPKPILPINGAHAVFGHVWEWTSSAYGPYPGFKPEAGAIGEYNGKFMCSQLVLRGGSCVSNQQHLRSSYRNFFYPKDRWQFSGIRLAKSI